MPHDRRATPRVVDRTATQLVHTEADPFEAGLARVLDGVAAHVDDQASERP